MLRCTLALLLTLVTSASAQPLLLDEVLASTRAHPLADAARAGVDRAEGQRLAAEGAFDTVARARGAVVPIGGYEQATLDAEVRSPTRTWGLVPFVGWRVGRGEFPIYDDKQRTAELGELRAGLELPLLRDREIDKPRAELAKAELAGGIARAELGQRLLDLERAAAEAYWRWVAAGGRLAVREQQLALARDRDAGLRRTIATGNTAPIEAVDNARVIAAREATVVAAQRDVTQAALELSLYLRTATGAPVVPSVDQLPPLPGPPAASSSRDLDAVIAEARTRVPALAALEGRRAAAAVDLELAENQLLPKLTASGYVGRGLGSTAPDLDRRSEPSLGLGLTFELPLERRQARGAVAIARAERARITQEQRFLAERIATEIGAAYAELEAARRRAELAADQAQLAEQLAVAERTRFDRGDSTILIVNLREEAAADAAATRIDAIAMYHRALARFAVATGRSPG